MVLILIYFCLLTLGYRLIFPESSKTKAFLHAGILLSLSVLGVTEVLNLFKSFNNFAFTSIYISLILILSIFLFKNKKNVQQVIGSDINALKSRFKTANLFFKISFFGITGLLIIIITQGILYPPNNWDSLTYHLPRVIHWFENNTLQNYATPITRQLYQPPFAEYFILNIFAIDQNDTFFFGVQFFYFILSAIGVYAITTKFTTSIKEKNLALLFSLTLPEAILQASSTQNDIVNSFFILIITYLYLEIVSTPSRKNFVFLGVAIGIGILTKALVYVYIAPITIVFIILYFWKQRDNTNIVSITLQGILITLAIIVTININHSKENIELSGSIFGTDKQEQLDYALPKKNAISITSNVIKNIGLQLDPFFINNLGNRLIEKTHLVLNYDVNQLGNNYMNTKFSCNPTPENHEDTQPNFIHLLLIIATISITFISFLLKKERNKQLALYIITIVLSFILFCTIFKWQPWNTRLTLPIFYLFIPIIPIVLTKKKLGYLITYTLFALNIVYCFKICVYNYSRPLITKEKYTSSIKLSDSRSKKYFSNNLEYYKDVQIIKAYLKKHKVKNLALDLHLDSWEYIFQNDFNKDKIHLTPINISNLSHKYLVKIKKTNFEYIVSSKQNDTIFNFNNKKFINLTSNNKSFWLYKLKK